MLHLRHLIATAVGAWLWARACHPGRVACHPGRTRRDVPRNDTCHGARLSFALACLAVGRTTGFQVKVEANNNTRGDAW